MISDSEKNKGTNKNPVVIIKNRLYWVSDKKLPKSRDDAFYFCIDDGLEYIPFL